MSVKSFEVVSDNYSVREGDKYTMTFANLDRVHDVKSRRTDGHPYIQRQGNLKRDPELLEKISAVLDCGRSVGVFYFDIVRLHEMEQGAGLKVAEHIIKMFNDTLTDGLVGLYKTKIRILASESLWGDDFILITETLHVPTLVEMESISVSYRMQIKEIINKEFLRLTSRDMDVHVGYAVITDKGDGVNVQFYNAIKKAFGIAKGFVNVQSVKYQPEFKNILEEGKLYSVYQPIVSLRSAAVLGWEALIRGPENSFFHRPDNIFSFAEAAGFLLPLEKICRESALKNLGELGPDQKIFINFHPDGMNNGNFVKNEIVKITQDLDLKPANVVFEITERHQIKDFRVFNRMLINFREQGFLLAVDDVGSGFSSLESIAEIRPNYIKIDISLVRGIHNDRIKTALMETFVTFAEKIGCEIIAEGIEEDVDLAVLVNIGVHYGQGYFFGKPTYPKQMIQEETHLKMFHFVNTGRHHILKHAFPIGDIVDEAVCINENMLIKEVKNLFESNAALSGIVVVKDNKPCGLIMRQHMDSQLSKKYGVALYYEKSISRIMDKSPLIVENGTAIELVSQVAMNRNKTKLYDNIVITRDGLLHGIVSVQTLLDTMTRIRVELAKGANPLTGLPGNIAIEQEFYRRTKADKPFCITFVDLDFFKSYNDKYGFEKGDEVLIFTANVLKDSLKECGNENDFLSHIGGDDFVIFTTSDYIDSLCNHIIKRFDSDIKNFYSHEDQEAGRILAHDRSGNETWFPLISVSMAVLDCATGISKDIKETFVKVAQLKQYAKSKPGSVYVHDRRLDH